MNEKLTNLLLSFAGKKELKKVDEVSKDCKKASVKNLRNILQYTKNTDWGKTHNFSKILKEKDDDAFIELYRKNVPVSDYEKIRPLIERLKRGDENVLFPGKPLMYATTSGTTGNPKWIPISEVYQKRIYANMSKLWLYGFIRRRKDCFSGRAVVNVAKFVEGEASDGTVFGSISGMAYKEIPPFLENIKCEPDSVFEISDYMSRYYVIMRLGIEQNVTIVVTANPSTILEMQNSVNQHFEEYIEDIENGTLNKKLDIPESIRTKISETLSPNPKRAAELRTLKEKYGSVLPKHYWPNLRILVTWKCGNSQIYIDKTQGYFNDDVVHQEFSYFATECRAGLILDETDATVLFPHYHFFEFVREEDLDNPSPEFLQIQELEDGKRYSIYVTTWSGLYRYPMNDLVVVDGFYGTIPKIKLVQKINGIISMTGEKVHENQFIDAVHFAEKETNIKVKFFVGFADVKESVYHFYYEFENQDIQSDKILEFNNSVDKKLKYFNIEYFSKRKSNRIKTPIPYSLQKDSFELYKRICISRGARDGQFKLNLLMQNEVQHSIFKELIKISTSL